MSLWVHKLAVNLRMQESGKLLILRAWAVAWHKAE